jgi:hypothetical protein
MQFHCWNGTLLAMLPSLLEHPGKVVWSRDTVRPADAFFNMGKKEKLEEASLGQ